MFLNFDNIIANDTSGGNSVDSLHTGFTVIAGSVEKTGKFIGSNIQAVMPETLNHTSHEWLLMVLLLLLAIVALMNFLSSGRMLEIFAVVFSVDKWKKYFTENSSQGQGVVIPAVFFLNFLVTASLLFYLYAQNFLPEFVSQHNKFELAASFSAFLFLYVFSINLIIVIINKILGQEVVTRMHLKINNNIWYITGIFLLPLLLIYIYTSSEIWLEISMFVFLLFFGLKMLIFLFAGIKNFPISGFHIFLYLCTLEILPLLVVIKFLSLNVL